MNSRIEFAAFESIKRGANPLIVWLLLIGVPAFFFGSTTIKLPDPLGLILEFVSFMIALLVVPVLLWVFIARRHTFYQIDSDGLIIRGLFGAIAIRWREVQSAQLRQNGALQITTSTSRRVFRLDNVYLLASVYQHLRRYLPASELDFGGAIEPFFAPMPDDLPAEAEWVNPKPVNLWPWRIRIGAMIVLFGCAAVFSLLERSRYLSSMWTSMLALAGLINTAIRDPRSVARRVKVTPGSLIVDLCGHQEVIDWDRIYNAVYDRNRIHITSRVCNVVIPDADGDPALDRLVSAISHWLRSQPSPILLPTRGQLESPIWAKWGCRHE